MGVIQYLTLSAPSTRGRTLTSRAAEVGSLPVEVGRFSSSGFEPQYG